MVNSVGSSLWCCFGSNVVEESKPLLKPTIKKPQEPASQPKIDQPAAERVEPKKAQTPPDSPLNESSIYNTPNSDLSCLSGFDEESVSDITVEDSIDLSIASPYSSGYASQLGIDDTAGEMTPETQIAAQTNPSKPKSQRKLRFEDMV